MNKNKGIIGVGLILAIVLGVVVVGGGAFYLGTKKNIENNKVVENPNIENISEKELNSNNLQLEVKNGPLIDNTNYVAPPRLCNSNTDPWIQVLSPNGGETYTVGQKVIVKWKSCNITENASIFVDIYDGGKNQFQLDKNIDKGTINDWSEEFLLGSGIKAGSYVLRMTANVSVVGQIAKDESDNYFTINSSTKTISTTDWKTYINSEYGFSFKYPNTWSYGKPSNAINLKEEIMSYEINFNDTANQSIFSLSYNLPPYGPEVYKIAEDQYNSYKNSNEFNFKKDIVAGNTAIESFTIMSKDIKGNIYDPALKLIHIVFLDKQKTGSFNLNFRTSESGSDKEIAKFDQLLSTFKFIN